MAKLYILDVGHGNCAVLVDDADENNKTAIIIDAGQRGTLVKFIVEQRIRAIKAILVSHADDDHIGGLASLLPAIRIPFGTVYINPHQRKKTDRWRDILSIVKKLESENASIILEPQLNTKTPADLKLGGVQIEILWPQKFDVMGPSFIESGRGPTSNALSGVIRLIKDGTAVALLAGDMDDEALEGIPAGNISMSAKILVFPHHGGKPGERLSPHVFTTELCRLVAPEIIIFSIGRNKHSNPPNPSNPRPEIVESIRSNIPHARILCTQLSKNCAPTLDSPNERHLTSFVAQGRTEHTCCAGTIVVDLDRPEFPLLPDAEAHLKFVKAAAPEALCTSTVLQDAEPAG